VVRPEEISQNADAVPEGWEAAEERLQRKMFDHILPFHDIHGLSALDADPECHHHGCEGYDASHVYDHNHHHYGEHYAEQGYGGEQSPYSHATFQDYIYKFNVEHYGTEYADNIRATYGEHLGGHGHQNEVNVPHGYSNYGGAHSDHSGHVEGQPTHEHEPVDHVHVVNGHVESGDTQVDHDHGAELTSEENNGANLPPTGYELAGCMPIYCYNDEAQPATMKARTLTTKTTTVRASPAHLVLSMHALTLAIVDCVLKGEMKNVREDAVKNAGSVTPLGAFILREHLLSDTGKEEQE
jgi:hypothetical protein